MDRLAVISRHIAPQDAAQSGEECPAMLMSPCYSLSTHTESTSHSVESTFKQAETAANFPPAVSDYFGLGDLLTPKERDVRDRVRSAMEQHVAPVAAEYWEKAKFPFHLVPKLAELKVSGTTIKGYGCPGLSVVGAGMAVVEMARVDASHATFLIVHSSLAMLTIALCGSEEQKHKYLPKMASLDWVGCWALTEPDFGSDASALATTATKVEGGWRLNGYKRWIGNSTFAEVIVVFARNVNNNEINAFIVRKGAPGFQANKMENKIGLRIVQNGDITLSDVFVPDDDRLPGVESFKDTAKVLAMSRVMVAWQPVGICMGVYDMAHRYLQQRKQFGVPLASYQVNQEKLVRMLGNIQAMGLLAWRLSRIYEEGKMTPGQASMAKSWITLRARETVALGRELLGGNGILAEFLVAKAFCDLEPIYTYEGTYDINALVTGREVSGLASFKAPRGKK